MKSKRKRAQYMKKKLLAILLALCVVTGTVIASPEQMIVQAAEDTTEDGDFWEDHAWELDDGTIEIFGFYENTTSSIVIPSEIDGKKVTSIGTSAFANCSNLSSITIPDSVTNIGDMAFDGCNSLTNIILPESIITIGDFAFDGCISLTSITLPKSVKNIGSCAFRDCKSLSKITIPDSVLSIEDAVFYGCSGLTAVVLPDSITSIKEKTFFQCSSLSSITFPNNLKSIGDYAFNECGSLTSITLPNSLISIGESTFENCRSLSSVTIPNSVTSMGEYAFNGCSSLTSVTIPNSMTSILGNTFSDCVGLTTVTLPNALTSIGEYAFWNCGGLTSITIPASVNRIDSCAFASCDNLRQVVLLNPNAQIDQTAFDSFWWEDKNQTVVDGNNNTITAPTSYVLSYVSPSVNSVIYNGGEQKPSVVVTDTAGQVKDASNYTITYSNNVNVGQATITVTGIGNCTGTVTATFTILPKGTKLSKVTAKKKKALVKWKKQTAQTTGYQIQYGRNAKFNGAKITTIKKNKTVSATLKKLKAKKKYYVRIRTYKNVQINGRSTQLYSNWSKAKKVKVK